MDTEDWRDSLVCCRVLYISVSLIFVRLDILFSFPEDSNSIRCGFHIDDFWKEAALSDYFLVILLLISTISYLHHIFLKQSQSQQTLVIISLPLPLPYIPLKAHLSPPHHPLQLQHLSSQPACYLKPLKSTHPKNSWTPHRADVKRSVKNMPLKNDRSIAQRKDKLFARSRPRN